MHQESMVCRAPARFRVSKISWFNAPRAPARLKCHCETSLKLQDGVAFPENRLLVDSDSSSDVHQNRIEGANHALLLEVCIFACSIAGSRRCCIFPGVVQFAARYGHRFHRKVRSRVRRFRFSTMKPRPSEQWSPGGGVYHLPAPSRPKAFTKKLKTREARCLREDRGAARS